MKACEAAILFLIQRQAADRFTSNDATTDPEFASALRQAQSCGVKLLAYKCKISMKVARIDQRVDILLQAAKIS